MNSYQKLKAKNRDLTQQLYILVFTPDSYNATEIKAKYKLLLQVEKAIMSGTHRSNYKLVGLEGSFFAQEKPLDEFLNSKH
jgi:hypothetical protein